MGGIDDNRWKDCGKDEGEERVSQQILPSTAHRKNFRQPTVWSQSVQSTPHHPPFGCDKPPAAMAGTDELTFIMQGLTWRNLRPERA